MKHVQRLSLMLSALLIASCSSVPHEKLTARNSFPTKSALERGSSKNVAATLIFERGHEQLAMACPALIYVDGTLRAKIWIAQSASVPIKAGYTSIRIKLGKFCGMISDQIISVKAAPGAEYRYRIGVRSQP